tara:strand:- start:959 stop:1096 length:138 start_codon:yes stop_codon:yes gene_type:complete
MPLLVLMVYLLMIVSSEGYISVGGTLILEMSDLYLNLSSRVTNIP